MDMDMGTNMFQTTNMALARTYWYIFAGFIGLFVVIRAIYGYDARTRLRACASTSRAYPTQPANATLRLWATLMAVAREMTYPQLYVPFRYLTWLTPPPAGRIIILLIYWAVVIGFMCINAIMDDIMFWERIGFRNAWISITQLPLLYLLAGKVSILTALTGVSHERLSWMHRWVARTVFITASVHGWHFYTEYARAGLTAIFFQSMPMGKYGIAAWGLLLWSCVVGTAPIRRLYYELFVLQHLAVATILLWLLHVHIPSYAQYNIWYAVAALLFERVARFLLFLWQNVRLRPYRRAQGTVGGPHIGYEAQIRAVGDNTTVVTIKDVHFTWRAGQHLYLWMPRIGPLEQHPYTIACAHQLPETCICNNIQLVVRKHSGFSKRLHERATQGRQDAARTPPGRSGKNKNSLTAFVTGPFGEPARWDIYETLVLISASTGASFTLPILESVINAAAAATSTICTKRIDFLLAAKTGEEIGYYVDRLQALIQAAADISLELSVSIAITKEPELSQCLALAPPLNEGSLSAVKDHTRSLSSSTSNSMTPALSPALEEPDETVISGMIDGPASGCAIIEKEANRKTEAEASAQASTTDVEKMALPSVSASNYSGLPLQILTARPDIAAYIRAAVEATGGETSVVVCGGPSLVARTRNCVARLSDERAVHKGTGAQGIHLHVEEYNF